MIHRVRKCSGEGRSRLVALIVAAVAVGCGGDDAPDRDRLHEPGEAVESSDRSSAVFESVADLDQWAKRLTGARATTEFGALDDRDLGAVLGRVLDVEVDSDGRVIVADGLYHDLKVFNPAGELLETVGRNGRGPGEFIGPLALLWTSPGVLVVFDDTRRATRFERGVDGAFRLIDTFMADVGVERACVDDEGIWVHGFNGSALERLHLLDRETGAPLRSIAPATPTENSFLTRRQALGYLGCRPELGILLTSRYFPTIQRLDSTGAVAWTDSIPGFTPMEFTVVERGGLRQGIAEGAGGFNWVLSAELLDARTALVQVGWQTVESSEADVRYASIESHLVSFDTGRSQRVPRELPIVMHADESGFFAARDAPFPQVVRFEY